MRITIVDDHVLFAEAVGLTLESQGFAVRRIDLAVPGSSLAAVLAAVLRSGPRLVLLDLRLGRIGDGTSLVAPIVASGAVVVILTGSTDRAQWGECLRRGAQAVLVKSSSLDLVVATVRRVREGLPLMTLAERGVLIEAAELERLESNDLRDRLECLTHREMEVLGALMAGAQVREIARTSVVSEATVRTQVKAILAKLELTSQLAAVGAAFRVGWRCPED
ncbi:response regulator transcription factor [Nocardioides ginsengisoli]|uniref:Response regulator n=1 Tax=Nocardioides ginsengisoli TaxID=363868 RepID=A0ABW3VW60_9ACTN